MKKYFWKYFALFGGTMFVMVPAMAFFLQWSAPISASPINTWRFILIFWGFFMPFAAFLAWSAASDRAAMDTWRAGDAVKLRMA